MKYILIFFIKIYQLIPGPWHNYCRHLPTCSNYSIEALEKHGLIKGLYLSIKRILKCNPWSKPGYDPVPERRKV
jgi:putative membrane protein insertion efficiency factor